MSNNISVPQKDESTAEFKPALSFVQGIALIFGTNIGAGVLSIPMLPATEGSSHSLLLC